MNDRMLEDKYNELGKAHVEAMNKVAKLEADNAKLKACVEFYADYRNYEGNESQSSVVYSTIKKDQDDMNGVGGEIARQTLKEIEDGK